mmetsp:Transcript_43139/g.101344  ORF Transcript_43139/g.101344 Transcript_43139/m.101344 type:complete len:429 (-) Transcript_43139:159-1445(-)
MVSRGAVLELDSSAVLLARLQWADSSSVDIDLQAIVVDSAGRIIDAAYYNNMKACGKALTHSGDEAGRESRSNQEEVRVVLSSLPASVHMVLFVACCFSGGSLKDTKDSALTFEQLRPARTTLGESQLKATTSGLLVSSLVRGADSNNNAATWQLEGIEEAMYGRHFMDCLDSLNKYIVSKIPTANRKQKVAFAMDKGDMVEFGTDLRSITLGLGWDIDKGEIDLDASAILLGQTGDVLESIFFGNLQSCQDHSEHGAVRHSGDNLTGAGDGDDERIFVKLDALGPTVYDVFFCIHIYSKGRGGRVKTFSCVAAPYCRVTEGFDVAGEELCRYTLTEAGDKSGLIIARLHRAPDGRWGFHALGSPCTGTMYRDAFREIQRLVKMDIHQLQRAATQSLSSAAPAPAPSPSAAAPILGKAQPSPECCSIQ